jgi:hypothetical protein
MKRTIPIVSALLILGESGILAQQIMPRGMDVKGHFVEGIGFVDIASTHGFMDYHLAPLRGMAPSIGQLGGVDPSTGVPIGDSNNLLPLVPRWILTDLIQARQAGGLRLRDSLGADALTIADGGVAIGAVSANACAVLDLVSTTKGFLPPRMTQAQRESIAAGIDSAGLLVYQTDAVPGFWYYNGASWLSLADGAGYLTELAGDARYVRSETDPLFSASAASGIASVDLTKWNQAHEWGNHADFGYLTAPGGDERYLKRTDAALSYLAKVDAANVYVAKAGGTMTGPLVVANNSDLSVPSGRVAIGSPSAHPSSVLDLVSDNKGFLPPRMIRSQRLAIPSPVQGLLVYETDIAPGFWCFNGADWMPLVSGDGFLTQTSGDARYLTKSGASDGYVKKGGDVMTGWLTFVTGFSALETASVYGSMVIGWDTISDSAVLDLVSTTKGLLVPRMADTSGIASPADGLLVYLTSGPKGFSYYDSTEGGGVWKPIQTAVVSDRRLKDRIQNTRLGLAELLRIQVCDFVYRSDAKNTVHTGFIAQDLNGIYPDAVNAPRNDHDTWTSDYGKLTPLLVKAVQDQQTQIESLKSQNADLLRRLEALEEKIR